MKKTGEFEKRIKEEFVPFEAKIALLMVDEARKDLQKGSHNSWVSPDEPKPATRYICIEYGKFLKWFGEVK